MRYAARAHAADGMSGQSSIIGAHPKIERLIGAIRRAAPLTAPVLIQGPTGAGKELVARMLHTASGRPGPLVALNVASLPETLVESDLFGSVRGAYTGAHADRPGLIAAAAGGTLYLDEATELSVAVQAKLLRVLESGVVRPVGGMEERPVEFRLVLSVQEPAAGLVLSRRWRADFYYRVIGLSLEVPRLAERASDIPLLIDHFLALMGRPPLHMPIMDSLMEYTWPGNVRELRRVVERAAFSAGERPMTATDLDAAVAEVRVGSVSKAHGTASRTLRDVERDHIITTLQATQGNTRTAATLLGLSRSQLYRRMHTLGILPPRRAQPA